MSEPGLLFEHPSSHEHDPGELIEGHPESPRRMRAIDDALTASAWLGWERHVAPPATRAELEGVHDTALIEHVERLAAAGGGLIDLDTAVAPRSLDAALHAAGGACALVRGLLGAAAAEDRSPRFGFALLRPPGHHAEGARAMGFCLFNNIAVAAQLARSELGVERVLIIDWDVHHGNGTAEIFRYRSDVLYASIHRGNFYPGTGALDDAGSGEGLGYTVNLPVAAGTEGDVWRSLVEHLVVPVALRYQPELILISAGFDAHEADPLGGCRLATEDFAQLACQVRDLGRSLGAPVGAVLEGGYEPSALADSVLATMGALGGSGEARTTAPDPIYTRAAAARVGHHWQLDP